MLLYYSNCLGFDLASVHQPGVRPGPQGHEGGPQETSRSVLTLWKHPSGVYVYCVMYIVYCSIVHEIFPMPNL